MRISQIMFLLAVYTAIAAEEQWARSLEKQGVVIETRKVSGSDYKEFRATMTVKASLQKSLLVMQDFAGYKSWMKDCKESRRVYSCAKADCRPTNEINSSSFSMTFIYWPS